MNKNIRVLVETSKEDTNVAFASGAVLQTYHEYFCETLVKTTVKDIVSKLALVGVCNLDNEDIVWAIEHMIKTLEEHFEIESKNT